jgi:flagellin
LNADAKQNIQSEITQLKAELTRIADTTQFNGTKLLDGNYKGTFQVGANAGETISVNIGKAMSAAGLAVDGVDVTAAGKYTTASAAAAGKVNTANATSASAATLTFTPAITGSASAHFGNASGDIKSFDDLTGQISFGGKTFDLASVDYSGLTVTGTPATDQAAALTKLNDAAKAALGLTTGPFSASGDTLVFKVQDKVDGYTDTNGVALQTGGASSAAQIAAATATFSGATGASDAIKNIDAAIKAVSSQRADLGAIQNRFEHTVNNLNTAIENTTASESRIRDTDMASEMTNFTRAQVLTQAGTSMLAQANQSTQTILKLQG